jgi:hypothetical protein
VCHADVFIVVAHVMNSRSIAPVYDADLHEPAQTLSDELC